MTEKHTGMEFNQVIIALTATLLLGNLLVSPSCRAETTITQEHQLIEIQTRDEPLRTVLAAVRKESGIAFSYSVPLGAQRLSAQVRAATWEEALRKLLVDYSTAFIWNASGELTNVNLLHAAANSHNSTFLAPLNQSPSGPPAEQYNEGDSGTSEIPPGATAAINGSGPPANHVAGQGPPSDEPPNHPEASEKAQKSMSGLFNALKIDKAQPR
ncbi:MAG: hypothetical protein VW985_13535 [Gammaproteobacteria bacterium]